jgi:hypothetical protein
MMIECKATAINLNDAALQQVLRYNISVPVSFLIITNGHYTFGWERTGRELNLINKCLYGNKNPAIQRDEK